MIALVALAEKLCLKETGMVVLLLVERPSLRMSESQDVVMAWGITHAAASESKIVFCLQ